MTWQIQANLAGVKERKVGGFQEPETGAYKVTIVETKDHTAASGGSSVMFQLKFLGGAYDGLEQRIFIGQDISKGGNQRSWRTALLSVGYTATEIDAAGEMSLSPELFDGKEAYIHFKARDPNDQNSQSDRQFITPEQFAELTAEGGAKAPAPAAKPSGLGVKSGLGGGAKASPAPAMTPAGAAPKPSGAAGGLRGMLRPNA